MNKYKNRIACLERELENKNQEILRLHNQLGMKQGKGIFKSNFCKFCENYIGIVDGVITCKKHDNAPCKDFKCDNLIKKKEVREVERNKENLLEEAENALIEFIIRVSKGNATCETEIAVLPQVANALLEYEINKGKPKEIADLVVALQGQLSQKNLRLFNQCDLLLNKFSQSSVMILICTMRK